MIYGSDYVHLESRELASLRPRFRAEIDWHGYPRPREPIVRDYARMPHEIRDLADRAISDLVLYGFQMAFEFEKPGVGRGAFRAWLVDKEGKKLADTLDFMGSTPRRSFE